MHAFSHVTHLGWTPDDRGDPLRRPAVPHRRGRRHAAQPVARRDLRHHPVGRLRPRRDPRRGRRASRCPRASSCPRHGRRSWPSRTWPPRPVPAAPDLVGRRAGLDHAAAGDARPLPAGRGGDRVRADGVLAGHLLPARAGRGPQDRVRRDADAQRRGPGGRRAMQDVPQGEVGEIVYRSPMVMREYWGKPAETAEAFAGGWFHSGDLVRQDEEGYFFVVDRKKDMIISGGENIYCAEVEDVLAAHPRRREVALIGCPTTAGARPRSPCWPPATLRRAHRRRAHRVVPGAAGALQVPARVPRRRRAPEEPQRQGPQDRAPRLAHPRAHPRPRRVTAERSWVARRRTLSCHWTPGRRGCGPPAQQGGGGRPPSRTGPASRPPARLDAPAVGGDLRRVPRALVLERDALLRPGEVDPGDERPASRTVYWATGGGRPASRTVSRSRVSCGDPASPSARSAAARACRHPRPVRSAATERSDASELTVRRPTGRAGRRPRPAQPGRQVQRRVLGVGDQHPAPVDRAPAGGPGAAPRPAGRPIVPPPGATVSSTGSPSPARSVRPHSTAALAPLTTAPGRNVLAAIRARTRGRRGRRRRRRRPGRAAARPARAGHRG